MANVYQLYFSEQYLPCSGQVDVYNSNNNPSAANQVYAFCDGKIHSFQYDKKLKAMQQQKEKVQLESKILYSKILYFPKSLNGTVILKTSQGIDFYQFKNNTLKLLMKSNDFEENEFHDVYGWDQPNNIIKFGHFYHDKRIIGVLTKHKKYGVKFYAIINEELLTGNYPIWPLEADLQLLGDCHEADIYLTDLKKDFQENIIVRTRDALQIYKFNQNNGLERFMKVEYGAKLDDSDQKLFFPNLTGQIYKDIIALNSSGLFMYQYNTGKNDYQFVNYSSLFAQIKGWNQDYVNSVQFEDIDSDGIHDMIFTGPDGIQVLSFDTNINQWRSWQNNFQLTISQRHSAIVKVVPPTSTNMEYPILFTMYKDRLRWANFVEIENSVIEEVNQTSNDTLSRMFPAIVPQSMKFNAEKFIPMLRDQIDCSSIPHSVDKATGKSKFSLPIIDLSSLSSDIRLDLVYDGSSKASGVLGLGWDLSQNYIIMDHQSSIFPEDMKYYVIVRDMPQQMILDFNKSTETVYFFNLMSKQKDLQIRYYKNEEKWEIESSDFKQTYGRIQSSNADAISWDLTWKIWRGVGSSSTGQMNIATAWHLVEVKDKHNNMIRYTYEKENASVPGGKSFTREVYLKGVSDNQGNGVIFNYSVKHSSEYDALPLKNKDGFLNMRKLQTRYIHGYKLTTLSFQQTIHFKYTVYDGKRFLISIIQEEDIIKEPIIKFTYHKMSNSYILQQVTLPTGLKVEFNYQLLGKISPITEKLGHRYGVPMNHRVDYISNEVLISYITQQGQVALRIFNQQMNEEIYSSISSASTQRLPLLGHGSATRHEVVHANSFLAIILYYITDKELYLFRKDEGKWLSTSKYYSFNEDAVIKFGQDFIVVAEESSSVQLIEWKDSNKTWTKSAFVANRSMSKKPLALSAYGSSFVVYDDNLLWIGYKDKRLEWKSKVIKQIKGVISDTRATLEKFELNEGIRKPLLIHFMNNALQLSSNLILLNSWKSNGMKLFSEVKLHVLNSKREIAQQQQYKVIQDDLTHYTRDVETNETTFTLAYKLENNRYKMYVRDFRGKMLDIIQEYVKRHAKNNMAQKFLDQQKDAVRKQFSKAVGNLFILAFQKYTAILSSQTALCGDMRFTFTGDAWIEDKIIENNSKQESLSVSLGSKLILEKINKFSNLKVFNQGSNGIKQGISLLDIEVYQLNQTFIQNMYPVYLAYQEKGKEVGVIEFSLDGNFHRTYKLPVEEKMTPWSSHQTLVTSVDSFQANDFCTLIFRHQSGIKRLLPNPVIKEVKIHLGNERKRMTGFEYSSAKALGDVVYYEQFSLVPGNDKSTFGWIEEHRNFESHSQASRNIFNSRGRLIKNTKSTENQVVSNVNSTDDSKMMLNSTVYDSSGRLEVVRVFPSEISSEDVGYYGFESYEINRIGTIIPTNKRAWLFDENDVVKKGFSFTGQNYLQLSKNTLRGTFQPINQHNEYVASCWMRPHSQMFALGAVTPYLKAIVYADNGEEIIVLLSSIKLQARNWFYLEVVIDLLYTRQLYERFSEKSTITKKLEANFTISIVIGPSVGTSIDVDHIRFSPINCDFQATVYDSATKQVKEVINTNGLIKRNFYNQYQEKIAIINEFGQIVEFSTQTKASSVGREVELKSSVLIQPETGFYEDFAPYSFTKRWIIDDPGAWKISPGRIHHFSKRMHKLEYNPYEINTDSFGMRLKYTLYSASCVMKFGSSFKLTRFNENAQITFENKSRSILLNGELLMIAEDNRMIIWVDGGLYFDAYSKIPHFDFEMSGDVRISEVMIFSKPSVQVTYFNKLDEKLQEIVMENEYSAVVTEYLYDELGRQTITTQPARIERHGRQSLLSFHPTFVVNSDPHSIRSVWKVGKIFGDVKNLISEYAYSQILYDDNPMDEKRAIGLPGKNFSVSGTYANRFSSSTENFFINNLFPKTHNFSYKVEYKPGNVEDISVFNSKNNRVAWYVHVPRSKDLLSTFEYDNNGKLILNLPPLYHEKVRTLTKLNPELRTISNEEQGLRRALGNQVTYDHRGNIISKTTPDAGKVENLYDDDGLLKYIVYYNNASIEVIECVVYFEYDLMGRLSGSGRLTSIPSKEALRTLVLSESVTKEYQQFHQSDSHPDPLLRGKMKRTITFNHDEPLIEESVLNIDQETLSKRILIPVEEKTPMMIVINKQYLAGRLKEIEYPVDFQGQAFRLTYSYNKIGKVTEIRLSGKTNPLVTFTYNPNGQLISEQYLPSSVGNFIRRYSYNDPGFLTKLSDKFLTEKVYYTSNSYGGYGYADGTVTRTEFSATWHDACDDRELGLNEQSFINKHTTPEQSALCFRELKRAGYINEDNVQSRTFYPAAETSFPIVCSYGITGRQIQKVLGEKGFPSEYGHSYDYGNHQELTKAKYFVGNEVYHPLQPDTFAKEIRGVNGSVSYDIWETLLKANYLINDNVKVDKSLSHAKRGKSFIRSTLFGDLRSVDVRYGGYKKPLERLLSQVFYQKHNLSSIKSILSEVIIKWNGSNALKQNASKIIQMLERKQYLQNPLNEEFKNLLMRYKSIIPDIVRVLSEYFARQLGEAEFDVESYDIDSNGNHKHYYTGFDRYELSYRNNTNQVNGVKFKSFAASKPEHEFAVQHDSRGSVIQALHKGIEQIVYNPVTNRATNMRLVSGKTITFYYDAQGERILKRVTNAQGKIIKETHYIRDEHGRSMVERELTYIQQNLPPDVLITSYIYGPKGLIGFMRRDEFYSVVTDHEGSIRLVVKNGEVVAAYDYLPYGNLMRKYGHNPDAHISYRYTGQEWDEETGLYNYHARFYDPSIGRFYQIDPKGQYFSPYKYAGNSPISMIDPDGQLAWDLILLGAYLGGAAANNNWNPFEWDWKDGSTYLGLIGGGITGALLPVGLGASVTVIGVPATIALGVGGTYFSVAATNNEWDPTKWDSDSPATWNAALQGFAMGSGAAGGFSSAHTVYQGLTTTGKVAFVIGSVTYGGATFVINGFNNNWDLSKPGVYLGLLDGITSAPDLPIAFIDVRKILKKNVKNLHDLVKLAKHLDGDMKNILHALESLGRTKKSLFKLAAGTGITVASILAMGSAANDGIRWDMTSIDTYQTIIHGFIIGKQFSSFGRAAYKKAKASKIHKNLENAYELSHNVAEQAKSFFKQQIDAKTVSVDNPSYSDMSKRNMEKGNIPNRAVAVAITKNHAMVGFSTNDAPGLLMLYEHKQFKNPSKIGEKILHNNEYIAGKKIAVSDNPVLNQKILDAIAKKQEDIKKSNIDAFSDQELIKILEEEGVNDRNVQNKIVDSLKRVFSTKGYVEKTEIEIALTKNLGSAHPDLESISGDIKYFSSKMSELSASKANIPKSEPNYKSKLEDIEAEMQDIKRKIHKRSDSLKTKKKKLITDTSTKILKFSDGLKEKLTHWDPTNCAEIHAIIGLSRMEEIFHVKVSYGGDDIKYLSTYKVGEELEPFKRCDHCQISANPKKEVLTDDWVKLQRETEDYADKEIEKLYLAKQQLYFLGPRFTILSQNNETTLESTTIDKKTPKRNRRSVKKLDAANTVRALTSVSETSFWVNKFYNWIQSSVKKMDYKSTLHEDTERAMSYVSAPIDFNGTLMLLDVLIRKVTGQKYTPTNDCSLHPLDAQCYALNVIEKFESFLKHIALKYGIPIDSLEINFVEVQQEITKNIISGKDSEIMSVLKTCMEKLLSNQKEVYEFELNNFIKKFDKTLNATLIQRNDTIFDATDHQFCSTPKFEPNNRAYFPQHVLDKKGHN